MLIYEIYTEGGGEEVDSAEDGMALIHEYGGLGHWEGGHWSLQEVELNDDGIPIRHREWMGEVFAPWQKV